VTRKIHRERITEDATKQREWLAKVEGRKGKKESKSEAWIIAIGKSLR